MRLPRTPRDAAITARDEPLARRREPWWDSLCDAGGRGVSDCSWRQRRAAMQLAGVPARRSIGWGVVTLFWILDGVIYALASGSLDGHELAIDVAFHIQWIPYTMMAIALTARAPIERGRIARGLAVHALGVAIVVVTRPLISMATNPWFHWAEPLPDLPRLLLNSVRFNFALYVFIVGAAHALHFAWRVRERERQAERLAAQLAAARLAALRAQLRPHFLFNALGGIAELIHRDPDAADRMVVHLSQLLRGTLRDDTAAVVTLAAELTSLEPYLELEKMRYGHRLAVVVDVDPTARGAHVPELLLQPIVENAIRHGLAPGTAPCTVTIRARVDDGIARVEVEDDGVGLAAGFTPGVGLGNTRARLAELYGTAASLELDGEPGRGTRVRIAVPQPEAA
jgi:two-component system, LytTR family, sensor kinase